MLEKLVIKNFAIIDDIAIDFNDGFSVLTGQTGSGKSILIQALSLIFGKRAYTDMIRHHEDMAIVSATFKINEEHSEILNLPSLITIERVIDKTGKNTIKVNDSIETLAYIREITSTIGLIHGQDEQYLLLDKNNYLPLLDQVEPKLINPLLTNYLIKRESYLEMERKIKNLEKNNELKQERLDYLIFQKEELEKLELQIGEEKELTEQSNRLKHFEKLSKNLFEVTELLDSNPGIDFLYEIQNKLISITEIIPEYQPYLEQVENSYYQLQELLRVINNELSNLSFDQNEFEQLQERLYEINRLTTKYQRDGDGLVNLLSEIIEEIELATNYDSYIEKLKVESNKLRENAYNEGLKLSKARKQLAESLTKEVVASLSLIDLPDVQFQIIFEEQNELLASGIDQIEFYISFNKSEPLKPLVRVASGGEKARFMFSFKTVLATRQNLSLLILDEIDIGISGKTASKMANEMVKISKQLQLIVITHLPQVSSKADYQYLINKKTINNRVLSTIDLLTESERVVQIASMISDDQVTSFALEQAKIMLKK